MTPAQISALRNATDEEIITEHLRSANPVIAELAKRLDEQDQSRGAFAELITENERLNDAIDELNRSCELAVRQRDKYYNRMIKLEQETQA